jgi:hypothetical protein
MNTKKISVFYEPSFRQALKEFQAKYDLPTTLLIRNLQPATREVEAFVLLVSNFCTFGPYGMPSSSTLQMRLVQEFFKQLTSPDVGGKLERTTRVEIRVSYHPAGDGFEVETFKVDAHFFEKAKKMLIVFGADIAVNDGAMVGSSLTTSEWLSLI